jgi:hypothetical protein
VAYTNGANVKYTLSYPGVVQPGATLCITVIAQQMASSPAASGLQLRFTASPASSLWIAGPSNVLTLGDLRGGAQARRDFGFTVSRSASAEQQLQVRIETADASSEWRSLSPDIVVTVGGAETTTASTTTEVIPGTLFAPIGLVVLLALLGIAAALFLTRRTRSAVKSKPILLPPVPPVPPGPSQPPPQKAPAAKPEAHIPRVVARRREEKK